MLFDGATVEQLVRGRKYDKGKRVCSPDALRKVHKLAVVKKDGVFRYDMDRMNGKKKAEGNKKRK